MNIIIIYSGIPGKSCLVVCLSSPVHTPSPLSLSLSLPAPPLPPLDLFFYTLHHYQVYNDGTSHFHSFFIDFSQQPKLRLNFEQRRIVLLFLHLLLLEGDKGGGHVDNGDVAGAIDRGNSSTRPGSISSPTSSITMKAAVRTTTTTRIRTGASSSSSASTASSSASTASSSASTASSSASTASSSSYNDGDASAASSSSSASAASSSSSSNDYDDYDNDGDVNWRDVVLAAVWRSDFSPASIRGNMSGLVPLLPPIVNLHPRDSNLRSQRRHGHSFRRGLSFRGGPSTRKSVKLRRGPSYLLFHRDLNLRLRDSNLCLQISDRGFQPLYYHHDQHLV